MDLLVEAIWICIATFYVLLFLLEVLELTIRDRVGCEKIFLYSYCFISIGINSAMVIFLICTLLIFVT
jgi:hypothetical protein